MQQSLPTYQITQQNLIYIVWVDELIHTDERPFCSDPECPCKEDATLNRMFINKPLDAGLLTNSEALRLYFGNQLVPTQDERITDEPTITDHRNEWNGYEQAMAWEVAEEQWRRATDSRDFEPDDPISDEEMGEIMREPSPQDADIEENYHRPLRVSAHFQGMMDSLLLEHD